MDFRILGPLEVRRDSDRPLELGGRKQRALLAVLLLHANRVVSTDSLAEALWGGSPPGTASTAIQGYVSQLRKRLAPSQVIVTRAPGYVLELQGAEFDLDRFERLLDAARRASSDHDPAGAAAHLGEALALWRGPALGDLADEPFARAEALRLEELRLVALEERIEADLALGRHAALVGELERHVAQGPLRERPRAQLMLALYRSGRQAEALAAYREARRVLVDELGIEPGRALQELEQAILRQDPALDLPTSSVVELGREPEAATPGELSPEPPTEMREERKVVSVLFVDLAGLTARAERADPEDVRAARRPSHLAARREIERFGGTVEKFIGDAVMAVFGAPVAHEDDAERAVRAGLGVLEAIERLNVQQPELDLSIRVGVETGEAVVALDARAAEGEGIATGDVVTIASRLQELAPAGGLVVGEATYYSTKDAVEYEQLEAVDVRGKRGAFQVWRAKGLRARTEPFVAGPFVGREVELGLLQQTFRRAVQEEGVQLVTVAGEPGVGKSRLVAELRVKSSERNVWLRGSCAPYGDGVTFWALGDIVKAEAGILESDRPEQAAEKLSAAVARAVEHLAERDWVESQLAPLVGAEGAEAVAGERNQSFTAWRRFLEGLASRAPLVLWFEDLHWADEALLDFVDHLVDHSTGVPLLVLCTARPDLYERRAAWGGGKRNSTTVSLGPLTPDETGRLLTDLLGRAVLPAETQAVLLERAGGNPLYAVEFVRMLTDRGLLEGPGVIPHAEIRVPETVQALIAGRLDTLNPQRKSLLQDAAVIGNVFWAGAVASVSGQDEGAVEEELHELTKRELIRPSRNSSVEHEAEYSFWHILVRDVAYRQIPRQARAEKHRAAAQWIEHLGGERVTNHAEFIAHHYSQALELYRTAGAEDRARELEDPAARSLVLAGDRALGLDPGRAMPYYRRALELLAPGRPERARILANIGEAGWLSGRYAEAEPAYVEAIAEFRAHGDNFATGETLAKLARMVQDHGERARAKSLLSEAVDLLERETPGPELVLVYTHTARYYHFEGPIERCLDWAEKAIATAKELGIEQRGTRALQYRGFIRFELGDLGGIADLKEALRIGLEAGLGEDTGAAYVNLGDLIWWTEGPAAGLDVFRAGIDFCERRGITAIAMWLKAECVWALYELGEWDALLQLAHEVAEWGRGGLMELMVLPYEAHVRFRRGEVGKAASLCDEFLPRIREQPDPQMIVPALAAATLIEERAGRAAQAVRFVEEFRETSRERELHRAPQLPNFVRVCAAVGAISLAETLLPPGEPAPARDRHGVHAARAVLAEAGGDVDQALALYRDAAEGWADYGFPLELGQALLGAGRCLLRLGQEDQAAREIEGARAIFATLGCVSLVGDALALLESEAAG